MVSAQQIDVRGLAQLPGGLYGWLTEYQRELVRNYARNAVEAALRPSGGAVATGTFVQTIPDGCDRIVWRGHYYHLPIAPPATSGLVEDVIAAARKVLADKACDPYPGSAITELDAAIAAHDARGGA